MPVKTERYRFVPWEIEDVNGSPRMLPGGYADVTRGGGMKYDQVVFLGPGGAAGEEFHLNRVLGYHRQEILDPIVAAEAGE